MIRIQPSNGQGYTRLAAALKAAGRIEEALAAYRQAIRINPEFHGGHYNLGLGLQAAGRLDEAEAAYREAIGTLEGAVRTEAPQFEPQTMAIVNQSLEEVEAAIDDLLRIAATPSAVAPVGDGSDGPSYALLLVGAVSLIILGLAALVTPLLIMFGLKFGIVGASGVLVNDGSARLRFQPLPRLAQIAPAFGVALTEVDGDIDEAVKLTPTYSAPGR